MLAAQSLLQVLNRDGIDAVGLVQRRSDLASARTVRERTRRGASSLSRLLRSLHLGGTNHDEGVAEGDAELVEHG